MPVTKPLNSRTNFKQNTQADEAKFPSGIVTWPTISAETEAELVAAVLSLGAQGGVILVPNNITIASNVVVNSRVTLLGRSRFASLIFGAAGKLTVSGEKCSIRSLRLSTLQAAITLVDVLGPDFTLSDCEFDSALVTDTNTFVKVFGSRSDIENCTFKKAQAPAANVGVSYEAGSVDNTYRALTFTT